MKNIIKRLLNWYKKPRKQRIHLLIEKIKRLPALVIYVGHFHSDNIYLAYQPDSLSTNGNHLEFEGLKRKFIANNRGNNSGDIPRLWSLILNLKQLMKEEVPGDFAELGVWRGNTASILAYFAAKHSRKVLLFDTFEGFNQNDFKGIDSDKFVLFENTSIKMVLDVIGEDSSVCEFVKGYFPLSINSQHEMMSFSAVSLDCDLYAPTKAGLNFFYPRLSRGGLLLLHDYSSGHWDGCKRAVDEFCQDTGEMLILMPDKSGSAFIKKSKN